MFRHLQIPYREERLLVGLADAGLQALSLLSAPFRLKQAAHQRPSRILLLRLERVGDLLMTLEAIAAVRTFAPHAEIDLVVGSWNAQLAGLIDSVTNVDILDVPWLSRETGGQPWPRVIAHARGWQLRRYDLAINFEPDIRSNILLALSGAKRRVGLASGGGGAVLTDALAFDPAAHVSANAKAVAGYAFGRRAEIAPSLLPLLKIPPDARRRAAELLGSVSPGGETIGIQPAAGRRIKEWHPARFAEVGAALARHRGAKIVMIGSTHDRAGLDAMRAAWPSNLPLAEVPPEIDLTVLAAVLERLRLFITGDTGPMHLAAAVDTPVLAIFGPSLPSRYAPLSARSRVVRIDLPCSPCNLLRRPPQRCQGHVPDCLEGIQTADVVKAAREMLES